MSSGATARPWRWLVMAVAIAATAVFFCTGAAAQPAANTLDVPYLPQTEDLCGGAAAAMVMRYWGATNVYPRLFEPLVNHRERGIRTADLAADLQRQGWTAVSGSGSREEIARELGRGRPVIVLLWDHADRYHYVVVVGMDGGTVRLHDPARAPSRAMTFARFDEAWAKAERWMLVLLPGPRSGSDLDSTQRSKSRSDPGVGVAEPCGPLIDEAVAQATAGQRADARRLLERATTTCAGSAGAWRELAGLDALDGQWALAAEHARRAVRLDANDAHGWRVLATASYVQHDDMAALAAWNHVGEPIVNLIDVKGLDRTRYQVIADAIGVGLEQRLTPAALRLAQRRVRGVPAVAAARVTFHPMENGRAQIDASIVERDRAPGAYPAWIGIGLGAAAEREISISLANVSGGGDVVTASWRWWEHRPRLAVSYEAPGPRALGGGVWRLDASRETQTFDRTAFEETRSHAGVAVSNWISERTRVTTGLAAEKWSVRPRMIAVSGNLEFWPVVDRLSLEAGATEWGGHAAFSRMSTVARWRSSSVRSGMVWLANGGYQHASQRAPASVWPGADTGHARDVLLRAHPLLDSGVITGGVFGRRLTFAGTEAQWWRTLRQWPLRVAPAAFVDLARATRGLEAADLRAQVDGGVGFRIALPAAGVLRIDIAHGLRDGRTALSFGFERR